MSVLWSDDILLRLLLRALKIRDIVVSLWQSFCVTLTHNTSTLNNLLLLDNFWRQHLFRHRSDWLVYDKTVLSFLIHGHVLMVNIKRRIVVSYKRPVHRRTSLNCILNHLFPRNCPKLIWSIFRRSRLNLNRVLGLNVLPKRFQSTYKYLRRAHSWQILNRLNSTQWINLRFQFIN